ncbi:hypothetical protein [Capnocytophaga canimorsus]|uniref:hypothetical protein n=1 Tax=Capnocytophaga canimorsus TaxID=28188 RepID=UPI000F4E66E5|nr:hypothetical protein [Capnocytophaga canimorsus]MDT9499883.1 hypothetical protein [Capnocytophaga canimorsus]
MKIRVLVCMLYCVLMAHPSIAQSKIQNAKNNLSTSTHQAAITESTSNTSSSSSYRSDSLLADFLYFVFFEISVGLTYHILFEGIDEINSPMYQASLSPYPFYQNHKGDYQYYTNDLVRWRLDVANYYLLEKGKLSANFLDLKFRLMRRLSISTSYISFRETLIHQKEKLDLFCTNLDYYRVRTPYFSMYWGLGAGYIGNGLNQLGLSVKTGSEIFIKPFTIQADFGYIAFKNNDITLFAIGPKYHLNRYHFGLKYQYSNLAGSRVSGVSFGAGFYF